MYAREHCLNFTPQNAEIRKLLDLARKNVCTVAPCDNEKSKATKKEKSESSGNNTKRCPIKNKKRAPGTKINGEDKDIVDPTPVDGKKAIMGFENMRHLHTSRPWRRITAIPLLL